MSYEVYNGYDIPQYTQESQQRRPNFYPRPYENEGYSDHYDHPPMHLAGAGRGAGSPRGRGAGSHNFHGRNMDAGFHSRGEEFFSSPYINSQHSRVMDMRDPPRVRTSNQYLPANIIQGMDSISLQPPSTIGKNQLTKGVGVLAREFEGISALGLSPNSKPYHDPRRDRKTAPEGSETYRLTWSQTRRIQNLNRPMIPVSIKIPLHDKHLWWESPTVTLNMFAPYSSSLVNGDKTIETRNYQLPNKCKGVRIGIVEIMPKNLPSKKPELIGEVVFVDCKEYTSKEEWEKDAPYHKVDANDERFGWKKNKKKFGWVVHTWQGYDRAIREAASEYCNTRVHYTKNFFVWAYV